MSSNKTEQLIRFLTSTVLDYRDELRQQKRFKESDRIRDEFNKFGIKLEDEKLKSEKG